jgi:heme a synthase
MKKYSETYNQKLYIWSIITMCSTFILIFIGGLVKSTESGLSVPDWPTTYGENMFLFPISNMVGGILYEHGHRLFASLVGTLILIQTIWIYLVNSNSFLKKMSVFTLTTVIIQGILGGLTVHYLLPVWISASHGTIAQTTLCLTVLLTVLTSKPWTTKQTTSISTKLFKISTIVTLLIWVQLVFGAVMRHSEAGLVAFDYPTMNGDLIPKLSKINEYNQTRNEFIWENIENSDSTLTQIDVLDEHLESISPFKLFIHFIHRTWALIVFGSICYFWFYIFKYNNKNRLFTIGSSILLLATSIQLFLGIYTIWSIRDILITTLHVANGSLVLATGFYLTIWSWRLKK